MGSRALAVIRAVTSGFQPPVSTPGVAPPPPAPTALPMRQERQPAASTRDTATPFCKNWEL